MISVVCVCVCVCVCDTSVWLISYLFPLLVDFPPLLFCPFFHYSSCQCVVIIITWTCCKRGSIAMEMKIKKANQTNKKTNVQTNLTNTTHEQSQGFWVLQSRHVQWFTIVPVLSKHANKCQYVQQNLHIYNVGKVGAIQRKIPTRTSWVLVHDTFFSVRLWNSRHVMHNFNKLEQLFHLKNVIREVY